MLGLFEFRVGVDFRKEKGEYLTQCPFRTKNDIKVGSSACQACKRFREMRDNEHMQYVTCRQPKKAAERYLATRKRWDSAD